MLVPVDPDSVPATMEPLEMMGLPFQAKRHKAIQAAPLGDEAKIPVMVAEMAPKIRTGAEGEDLFFLQVGAEPEMDAHSGRYECGLVSGIFKRADVPLALPPSGFYRIECNAREGTLIEIFPNGERVCTFANGQPTAMFQEGQGGAGASTPHRQVPVLVEASATTRRRDGGRHGFDIGIGLGIDD